MTIHLFWDDYPTVKEELIQTKQLIESNIFIRNQQVHEAAKDIFIHNGKMVRPAYALLFSKLGPASEQQRAQSIAASLEIFHNATLLHDDIIDEGIVRRGQPTIQARYGKKSAVYAGDYLISVCFRITHPYRLEMDVQGLLTRAMERVIRGELQQLDQTYNGEMTLRRYLTQIRGKTAELFALSCYAGAMESGLSVKAQWLSYRIGLKIGMAFQLMDDLLEYTQEEADWGKTTFQDIKNGIYTAPVIYTMEQSPEFFKNLLEKETYTDKDVQAIRTALHDAKGIEKAEKLAERYTQKALALIEELPNGKEKEEIKRLTTTLLKRKV
ncbi:polyprenyl synthetase family protein [Marinilactibacillus piezotolerans]|uniref:polyprenyl synthetase family protein n=1 Tax=Marinilactibacillus piezotolerans TaxID=258723 RepID=UPI0009AFF0B2|nr:polyprenyl synthetase family protein [Marinilactibacillus piezotolerans]